MLVRSAVFCLCAFCVCVNYAFLIPDDDFNFELNHLYCITCEDTTVTPLFIVNDRLNCRESSGAN